MLAAGSVPVLAGLPLHVNDLKDIEPQLSSLVALYKIDAVRFHNLMMDFSYKKRLSVSFCGILFTLNNSMLLRK